MIVIMITMINKIQKAHGGTVSTCCAFRESSYRQWTGSSPSLGPLCHHSHGKAVRGMEFPLWYGSFTVLGMLFVSFSFLVLIIFSWGAAQNNVLCYHTKTRDRLCSATKRGGARAVCKGASHKIAPVGQSSSRGFSHFWLTDHPIPLE